MLATALFTVAIEIAVRAAVPTALPIDPQAARPMSEIIQPHWEIRSVSLAGPDTAVVRLSGVQFGSLIVRRETFATMTLKLTKGEWRAESTTPVPEYRLLEGFDISPRNRVRNQPQTRPVF